MNIVLDEFSSKRRVRLERYRFAVLIARLLPFKLFQMMCQGIAEAAG
jgi:hypothetical protein